MTQSSSTVTSRKWPSRKKRRVRRTSVAQRESEFGPLSAGDRRKAVRSMPSPVNMAGSSSVVWAATRAAMRAPVAVPVMMRGSRPRRKRARTTPRWHRPKMAPPWRTRVLRPKACRVSWTKSSFIWLVRVLSWLPSVAPAADDAGGPAPPAGSELMSSIASATWAM